MNTLVALDPSLTSSGVAVFQHGLLVGAARVCPTERTGDIAMRCLAMAHSVCDAIAGITNEFPRALVMEWPQWYRATKSKVDPNDLAGLCGVNMAFVTMIFVAKTLRGEALEVRTYKPADWAGQLPKSKTVSKTRRSPRAERIFLRLNSAELEVLEEVRSHDVIDAVGIGLFALGRLQPVRKFKGAKGDTDE